VTKTQVIQVEKLCHTYPDGTPALRDCSLTIDEGERVALIGANGAGKSTLLLHLNGLYQGQGAIKVLGMDMKRSNHRAIREQVGLVFQNPDDQLFCPTVFEDVAFGLRNQAVAHSDIAQRVRESLSEVGLAGLEHKTAFNLSGGEKKRLALATVLAMRTPVLVLDEPTDGLDPRNRRELMELLDTLPATQVIATHDFDLARTHCHRVIIIHQGRNVYEGTPEVLLGDVALLKAHDLY
jgi:cobalt/nickel transport system ATP-binding protein